MGGQCCLNLALFTPLYFSEVYRVIFLLLKLNAHSKIVTIYHMQYRGSFKRRHLKEVNCDFLHPADLSPGNYSIETHFTSLQSSHG
jgi:hypothetical protein